MDEASSNADRAPAMTAGNGADGSVLPTNETTAGRLDEERLEALVRLNEMADASLDEITHFTLEEAVRLTGSQIGYVAFLDEDERTLTMHAWSQTAMALCRIDPKALTYNLETTGLWGEAVRQRRPVITNDYSAASPLKKGVPEGHVEVRRHMNVPVFDGRRIVIVAGVGNKPERYDDSDVRQLKLLMSGMWRIVERKRSEAALRESEEKYRILVEHAGEAIFVAQDGRLKFANAKTSRITGYSQQEIFSLPMIDFIHPEDRDLVSDRHRRRLQGLSVPNGYCFRILDRAGRIRWVEIKAARIQWEGRPATLNFLADITERRQAEEALRESEERYRLIFAHSPLGLLYFDERGVIVDCNDQFIQIIGSSRQALIGLSMLRLPDSQVVANVRKALDGGTGAYEGVYQSTTAPKKTPVRALFTPMKDRDGLFRGGIGIIEDISERRQAEAALAHSHDLMRYIIEHNRSAIAVFDNDLHYIYVSQRYLEDYRIGDRQIVGRHHYEIFSDLPDQWKDVHRRALAGEVLSAEDDRYERQDGSVDWIRWECRPWYEADGAIGGIILCTEIITERKSLQAQLLQAQKMESVGRLAGGVAHDFNNMLGVILGYTDLSLDHVEPGGRLYASLQEIRKAAERSAGLTRQLLAFARKQTITPRVLDLNDTVEGMLRMLRRLIGEDIELHWQPGAKLWPVKIDPGQIDQILANLCVNARDAIAGVGRVTIETRNAVLGASVSQPYPGAARGEYVLLSVSDDGCGMDKETLGKLFEPFFTTKETGKGTGLGLATVYGIVKQNEGLIDVQSRPGEGATFRIHLPRYRCAEAQTDDEGPAENFATGNETILLVEDEPAMLKMISAMLKKQGYGVLAAATADEAIALADACPGQIDLLMTDVIMPTMNGRDLAARLQSRLPAIKTLFMSGYTADVIAPHRVLEQGVNFVQKPFAIGGLAAAVRAALDGP